MTIEKVLTAVEELLDASTFSGRAVARKNLRRELSSFVTEEREACAMMCDEESERLRLGGQGEEAQAVHEMGGSIRMRSNVRRNRRDAASSRRVRVDGGVGGAGK